MKKVMFLLSLIFCLLLASCTGGQDQNAVNSNDGVAANSIADNQRNDLDNKGSRIAGTPAKSKVNSATLMKQALMEEVNVQFADDMEFSAVGDWSAADSRLFYEKCNMISVGKKSNPNLNVDKYCSCLKVIMLDGKYRPEQLNRAVRNQQPEVVSCLKSALVTE